MVAFLSVIWLVYLNEQYIPWNSKLSRLIAFESSGQVASVALYNCGEVTTLACLEVKKQTLELPGIAARLLADSNLAWGDLAGVCCGVGPGRFIGTRLAVVFSQSIAYGLGIPVVAVNSLAALVVGEKNKNPVESSDYLVVMQAGLGEYYYEYYSNNGEIVLLMSGKFAQDEMVGLILAKSSHISPLIILGNGAEHVAGELRDKGILLRESNPDAAAVLELGRRRFMLGDILDPMQLRAKYIRAAVERRG